SANVVGVGRSPHCRPQAAWPPRSVSAAGGGTEDGGIRKGGKVSFPPSLLLARTKDPLQPAQRPYCGRWRRADPEVMDTKVTLDRNGMVVLTERGCLARLGGNGVGRVAVSVGALPAVLPVNYARRGRDVYFRTAAGTKLAAAVQNAVVAFEVDHVDRI